MPSAVSPSKRYAEESMRWLPGGEKFAVEICVPENDGGGTSLAWGDFRSEAQAPDVARQLGQPPGPRRPRRQEGPERSTAPSGSLPQPCHPIPSSSHRALDVLLAFLLNRILQANRLPIHRSP